MATIRSMTKQEHIKELLQSNDCVLGFMSTNNFSVFVEIENEWYYYNFMIKQSDLETFVIENEYNIVSENGGQDSRTIEFEEVEITPELIKDYILKGHEYE